MEAKKPPLPPLCRDESALFVCELGINEIRKVSLLLLGKLTTLLHRECTKCWRSGNGAHLQNTRPKSFAFNFRRKSLLITPE